MVIYKRKRGRRMTKIVCDICGKDIPPVKFLKPDDDQKKFSISTCGRRLDICDECQVDLNIWMTNRCQTRRNEHAL